MFNYILKRLFYSAIAIILLLLLIFFFMQAIPGYPIEKTPKESMDEYMEKLRSLGLLDGLFTQLWTFIKNIFVKGEFGVAYKNSRSVIEIMLDPIKYTIWIAVPAFILSSVIGILLGTIAAFHRGKFLDIFINIISVLFVSVPSFIFALYLLKLARVIGLPTQFYIPGSGHPMSEVILSLITPILAMTLSSISLITYYTRNELVEVFEQDYIRTGLSKGYTFKQVIFKYGFRNASIPVITALIPSFMTILTGSIIIEKFFAVPGTAGELVNAITNKEIYIVMFSVLFFSGLYFLLQILVDVAYTILDPRITLATSNNLSVFKKAKALAIRKIKVNFLNHEGNIPKVLNFLKKTNKTVQDVDTRINFAQYQNINIQNYIDYESIDNFDSQTITQKSPINNSQQYVQLNSDSFRSIDIFSRSNEEIIGKPTTYMSDLCRRFFKSKSGTFFTILFGIIVLLSIIFTFTSWNTMNNPIGTDVSLPGTILGYLPPRIPWLGVSGTVPEYIVSNDMYNSLRDYVSQYNSTHSGAEIQLWTDVKQIGSQFQLINYNPYSIPGLQNVTTLSGTDGLGRDWWSLTWYSTAQSLTLSLLVSISAVALGTIYGSAAGFKAGSTFDILMMRFVDILNGVPLILWVMLLAQIVSGGSLSLVSLGAALILISWMWPAKTARMFIIKYKDAEFVQAARTLGASNSRIIFTHLLPSISGKLMVRLVNLIPSIIFFEASLVFLGIKSTDEVSLGSLIEISRQNDYIHMIVPPTVVIVLITLSAQIIANNLNDALDPKVSGA